jgi:hypothetical protein
MGLKSKLFRGDTELQAAAISDPAHILRGASGTHVEKIQRALIILDSAAISYDELQKKFYGGSTADAVLAYKRKRNIINWSYQTSADDIVGKMTMARLDDEMTNWEAQPHAPIRIRPLSYSRRRPSRPPHLAALLQQSRSLELNFALGANFAGLAVSNAALNFNPQNVLVVDRNGSGRFEVLGGKGGEIKNHDPDLITIQPSSFLDWVPGRGDTWPVVDDPQSFDVSSGSKLGEAQVSVTTPTDSASFSIVVTKLFPSPPPFHFLKPHNHQPSGKWPVIKASPNSDALANMLCMGCNQPGEVIKAAKLEMQRQNADLAVEHLEWYLSNNGADFDEGLNILRWLDQDSHIRDRLKREIFPAGKKPKSEGHFTFDRNEFDTKTKNFALSFGTIDRVDFSVDFSDDTVRVWFQDRYEFHPVYPGIYNKEPDDIVRGDNCVHAAAVEMKSQGAQDYWMKGQAVVPLSLITGP